MQCHEMNDYATPITAKMCTVCKMGQFWSYFGHILYMCINSTKKGKKLFDNDIEYSSEQ